MRMWEVPTKLLCDMHLRGEHVETHMFVASIAKGTSMSGFLANGLLNRQRLAARHDEVAAEMTRRGMNHQSPLYFDSSPFPVDPPLDTANSLRDLAQRCEACARRQANFRLLEERRAAKLITGL